MISKETLGKRLREARQRQKLTLKEVEDLSGLSSTHISEIERGMTSPTIGALIRIAQAMRKDPSYFLEDRELDEICVTTAEDRPSDGPIPDSHPDGINLTHLTRGILGGRLCVDELLLEPGGGVDLPWLSRAHEVCICCLEGQVQVSFGPQAMLLTAGDSLHGSPAEVLRLAADSELGGRVVLIANLGADAYPQGCP